jgi:hypothetical protein
MKVCPCCGHIDYTMWRQNRWRTNVEFLKMEYADAENIDPVVLGILSEKGVATDKYYGYQMNKVRTIIERVIRQEFDIAGIQAFRIPREKVVSHTQDIFQTCLFSKNRKITS